jgi:hypothetical protein
MAATRRISKSAAQQQQTVPPSPNTPAHDPVDRPSHYADGGIECIDVIRQNLTREQFLGYLAGNNQKYIFRWQKKGGLEDLRKANWYLARLIAEVSV